MFIEYRHMRVVVGIGLLFLVSCTRPNPRDCADGVCSDPAFPFCDIDGSLEGGTKTCIAVSCTPGDFRACRDDNAIVCNAVGNDYDLVQCQLGCSATAGCRSCVDNDQCSNPTPVCDAMDSQCRECVTDDECTSKICDGGACASGAGVLYATPSGSGTSDCSLSAPCELRRVLQLAGAAAVPPRIRMLPGTYPTAMSFSKITPVPWTIVATGAVVAAPTPVEVLDGASVHIRGLTTASTTVSVSCTSSTTTLSKVVLENSVLRSSEALSGLITANGCEVRLQSSDLDIGANGGVAINLLEQSGLHADRTRFHAMGKFAVATFGERIGVTIKNSLLERVDFNWVIGSAQHPAGALFAFNTIVLDDLMLNCRTNSTSAYRTLDYENNIIVSKNPSAIEGTTCKLTRNIIWPGPASGTSSIVADPQFVDPEASDFRIRSTSPAVDAAVTDRPYLVTDDFAGTTRPQGPAPDIGAFELP